MWPSMTSIWPWSWASRSSIRVHFSKTFSHLFHFRRFRLHLFMNFSTPNYKIAHDILHSVWIDWIPRNFQMFLFKPKFSFLNENHKNDNLGLKITLKFPGIQPKYTVYSMEHTHFRQVICISRPSNGSPLYSSIASIPAFSSLKSMWHIPSDLPSRWRKITHLKRHVLRSGQSIYCFSYRIDLPSP